MRRFCFWVGFGAFAVAGLQAADPDTPRVKTVVRADPRTGKLVRIVVPATQPANAKSAPAVSAARSAFNGAVERAAADQSLAPELLHSVIAVESNYNPAAVSPKGAQGLMQLMPETAKRFGVPDTFDPTENIQGGARYLKYLLDLYHGDYTRALAAYNAGEKAVAKYGGVPPYAETQNYVTQVQRRFEAAKLSAPPKPAAKPEPKPAETSPDAPRHIQEIVAADGSVRYVTQ